ncbi:hypothetical protein [Rhizobium sp. CAU 1783]
MSNGVETRWCPEHWLDEIVPALVDDPAELVHLMPDGRWIMVDDALSLDDTGHFCREELTPGQIVTFCAHRNYGDATLTIGADRSLSVSPAAPEDATHFALAEGRWDGGMFDSAAELAERGGDDSIDGIPLPAGAHEITIWHWSNGTPFRFDPVEGKPVFHVSAGAS